MSIANTKKPTATARKTRVKSKRVITKIKNSAAVSKIKTPADATKLTAKTAQVKQVTKARQSAVKSSTSMVKKPSTKTKVAKVKTNAKVKEQKKGVLDKPGTLVAEPTQVHLASQPQPPATSPTAHTEGKSPGEASKVTSAAAAIETKPPDSHAKINPPTESAETTPPATVAAVQKPAAALIYPPTRTPDTLPGVGIKSAKRFVHLGIHNLEDGCFHLPFRYQDRTRFVPMKEMRAGLMALVRGRIESVRVSGTRRRSLMVQFHHDGSSMIMRLFHFSEYQQKQFENNPWISCYGEARPAHGSFEMIHPEYALHKDDPVSTVDDTLTPVYRLTEGITQSAMRTFVQGAIKQCRDHLPELLSKSLCDELKLPSMHEALQLIHAPPAGSDVDALSDGSHPARQRIALEELVAHHLALGRLRVRRQGRSATGFEAFLDLQQKLLQSLPFALTAAQARALKDVMADLQKDLPALRLLQGDVGCGKTIVAAAASCVAVENDFQVAVMAPTELLAEQHLKSFENWFVPLGVTVVLLGGRQPVAERRAALESIASGEAAIVIGTHALFQQAVSFAKLGLLIVDEQHRFGVEQRLALRDKGTIHRGDENTTHDDEKNTMTGDDEIASSTAPHQLMMTATPIPRSLAMTFYADLDVSSIDELPPGRKTVHTVVLPATRRDEVVARVRAVCADGNQAYWVCPLIDESDMVEAQAASNTFKSLQKALPDLTVGLIHGRLSSAEKDEVMTRFRDGEVRLLVATTVVEVGVDVPQANLIIIENAERLGLSQLHQLRGRVGRGREQAWCLLMYQPPVGEVAQKRLTVLRSSHDGFYIAEQDLQQRGPGEVLGTRQTGMLTMRVADILRDSALAPHVERAANYVREHHPAHVDKLISRWLRQSEEYGDV